VEDDPLFESIKEITDDLLLEFKEFSRDYPLLTKMFMDLVAIVAQQNEQISLLSGSIESLSEGMLETGVLVKEHQWKLDILKEKFIDLTELAQEDSEFSDFSKEKKKVLLN